MLFSTVGQAQIFLVTVALGAALGLLHDGMRLLPAVLRTKPFQWLLEGAFFLGAAALAFAVLYRCNGGELQPYTLLGMGVGWCLYLLSLSEVLKGLCRFLCGRMKTIGNNRFFRSLFR